MKNLLKADFYRIFKSKLTLISFIIAVVLPLLTTLLYLGMGFVLKSALADEAEVNSVKDLLNCESMLAGTFSYTSNLGLVVPIFSVILVMGDITSGTIRNKVVVGYKRHQIFASHFISVLCYALILMGIYAGSIAVFGIPILGHGSADHAKLISYLYFYILGFVGITVIAAVICFFSLSLLNVAGSAVLSMVVFISLGILSSILSMSDKDVFVHITRFIPGVVVSSHMSENIKLVAFLEGLAGDLIFAIGFYLGGTFIFNSKDLK